MQTTVRTDEECNCCQGVGRAYSPDDENGRIGTLSVHQVGLMSVVLGYTLTPRQVRWHKVSD